MTHIKNFHVTTPPLGQALKGVFLWEDAVQLHARVLGNCWTLYTWWTHRGSSDNAVQGSFLRVYMFSQRLFQIMAVFWVSTTCKTLILRYTVCNASNSRVTGTVLVDGEVGRYRSHLPLVEALKRGRFRNHEPQLTRNKFYPSSHFRYDRPTRCTPPRLRGQSAEPVL
jgi:hypothetical protein